MAVGLSKMLNAAEVLQFLGDAGQLSEPRSPVYNPHETGSWDVDSSSRGTQTWEKHRLRRDHLTGPKSPWVENPAFTLDDAPELRRILEDGGTDKLAWYQPFHYFGKDAGIYIRLDGMKSVARRAAEHAGASWRGDFRTRWDYFRAATLAVLWHEEFHHLVEVTAIRAAMFELGHSYRNYKETVYRPQIQDRNRAPGLPLEEKLANGQMYRFLRHLADGREHLPLLDTSTAAAMCDYLEQSFLPMSPPGYREARDFIMNNGFVERAFSYEKAELWGKVFNSSPPEVLPLESQLVDLTFRTWWVVRPGQPLTLPFVRP